MESQEDIDRFDEDTEEGLSISVEDLEDPGGDISPSFNVVQAQEQTRSQLAGWLIIVFGASSVFSLLIAAATLVFSESNTKEDFTRDILTLVVTTQSGLVGTAVGFYFGKS
jgi:hypothetical protein